MTVPGTLVVAAPHPRAEPVHRPLPGRPPAPSEVAALGNGLHLDDWRREVLSRWPAAE